MIARATNADLAAIAEIEETCFGPDAWSHTLVRAELDAPWRSVLVARTKSAVVGYASVMVAADLADLQRVAVRPEARLRGYGRELVDTVLRIATDGGARRILLEVAADNAAAIGLYRAAGFGNIHRRVDYYGADRDAIVLLRALPA